MHLYLVSSPSQDIQREALICEGAKNHLLSYANRDELTQYEVVFSDVGDCRILIDSGAFTAFTLKKVYHPEDYAEWAHNFKDNWSSRSKSIRFFNLDVIGDQDKTWVNQEKLEKLGVDPIPVVTFQADDKHLEKAMKEYDYLALGGIVPHARGRKATAKVRNWLGHCFSKFVGHYKKTGVMPKVHLLGMGRPWVLEKYPAYSADTTSWVKALRWGIKNEFGIAKSPRVSESKETNQYILRQEIRKYREVEERVTKIWKMRGIEWDD